MFFYFSWICWIMVTFLSNKSKKRLGLSIFLLLLINFSQIYVQVQIFQLNIGGLFVCVVGLIILTLEKGPKIFIVFYSGIISMIYCILHFLVIQNPTIFIFPEVYLLTLIIFFSCMILTMNLNKIVTILFIGTYQGEFMLRFFLQEYEVIHEVGSSGYLEIISLSLFIILVFENIINVFSKLFKKNQKYGKGMSIL